MAPDYDSLFTHLHNLGLHDLQQKLAAHLQQLLSSKRHGDWPKWSAAVANLPEIESAQAQLQGHSVGIHGTCRHRDKLLSGLQQLHPWRKGPFQWSDVNVDAEWRSDLKWQRIAPLLPDLSDKQIIDIGCGNGYYLLRMLGAGAHSVLGIDPSPLTCWQFEAIKRYAPELPGWVFPAGIEHLPPRLEHFDLAFSMGVLYHRKSPLEHFQELAELLRPGGQLLLETLVIAGDEQQVLVPKGRYARMRNVWFLPSTAALTAWMERLGWQIESVSEPALTTLEEQRATEWMHFESLAQCLNPDNPAQTVEGYPAPTRVAVLAKRPN